MRRAEVVKLLRELAARVLRAMKEAMADCTDIGRRKGLGGLVKVCLDVEVLTFPSRMMEDGT